LPVDLGSVELCAALPQERRLLALAFGQHCHFAAHPLLLGPPRNPLLQLHEPPLARLDGPPGYLAFERMRAGAFLIGVAEDAKPVEPGRADELLEDFDIALGFTGEADDKTGAQRDARNRCAYLFHGLQENLRARASLHPLQYI